MAASLLTVNEEKIKYSKLLSSFFCSSSIIVLSFLCLLNNLSLDLYSACMLLKIVVPGSFSFWFLGYVMGHIFDDSQKNPKRKAYKLSNDNEAYNMPSMFAADSSVSEDGSNDLDGI